MKPSRAEVLTNYVLLVVFALIALGPCLIVVRESLQPEQLSGTGSFHVENYVTAWQQGHFSDYMWNSARIAAVVVIVSVVLSVLAGYGFGVLRPRGEKIVFFVFLTGIMVPTEAIVIPLFYDLQAVGLTNTVWGIALPQIAQSVAFGTFWMRSFFRGANASIIEAARIDGAGDWRLLFSVLVPIARPAILTMTVLVFMWTWNDFLIPLVLSPNGTMRTAPLGLAFFQGQYTSGASLLAAGAVLVALPMVVMYMLLQRWFIAGMVEGAVKG